MSATGHHVEFYSEDLRRWGWHCLSCGEQSELIGTLGAAEAAAVGHPEPIPPSKGDGPFLTPLGAI